MLKEYKFNDAKLKTIWNSFYMGNSFLFPYQSYTYNSISYQCFRFQTSRLKEKYYFYIYYDESKPKLIMPLMLKKGVFYIFGDFESVGALDFVYPQNISAKDFDNAFKELRQIHKEKLCLNHINEKSRLSDYIRSNELSHDGKFRETGSQICVKIQFEEYGNYYKSLSKSNRQNLRTSYNRLEKDGLTNRLVVDRKIDINNAAYKNEFSLYIKREDERQHKHRDFFSAMRLKYLDPVTVSLRKLDGVFDFKLYIDKQLAAFMAGIKSEANEIIVPKLAIDSQLGKYSPGKLLINESIKYLLNNTSIKTLDLSKGNEKYKYDMGGKEHTNRNFECNWKCQDLFSR